MTMTWRARCSRGHYLAAKDVHTTLDPYDWDDTCHCKTTAAELEASGETFGHEPEWDYVGYCGGCEQCGDSEEAEVCARCATVTTWRDGSGQLHIDRRATPWPCTSALVLGLVERGEAAA